MPLGRRKFFILINLLMFLFLFPLTAFVGMDKVNVSICHHTGSEKNPYVLIEITSEEGLAAHRDHELDIIPAPPWGCDFPYVTPSPTQPVHTPTLTQPVQTPIQPVLTQTPTRPVQTQTPTVTIQAIETAVTPEITVGTPSPTVTHILAQTAIPTNIALVTATDTPEPAATEAATLTPVGGKYLDEETPESENFWIALVQKVGFLTRKIWNSIYKFIKLQPDPMDLVIVFIYMPAVTPSVAFVPLTVLEVFRRIGLAIAAIVELLGYYIQI